jgi:hypothetical protein
VNAHRYAYFLELLVTVTLTCALSGIQPLMADEPIVEVLIGPHDPSPNKGVASELNTPFAIEFSANGEMVIVEYEGGRLLSWHEGHGLAHLAGNGKVGFVDGPAKNAEFNKLHNLVILADGSMLLSDHLNHAVRKYDPQTGVVSTLSGNGKSGPAVDSIDATLATYAQPICLSLVPDRQSVLIADIGNRCIRRLDLETGRVTILAGNGKSDLPVDGSIAKNSPLKDPRGAIQNKLGEVFLIERGGNAVRKIDTAGNITTIAGTGKAGNQDGDALAAQFHGPKHLCFGDDGAIFIADDENHAIRKYDPASKSITTVSFGEYKLNRPHGVCVHEGWLYVADSYHHRVLRRKL